MTRKDIALTVGGVLASMAVSYMIYRLEQRNAANAQAASDAQQQNSIDEIAQQQSYLSQLGAGFSIPSYTSTSANTSSVDTSSSIDPHTTESLLEGFSQQLATLASVSAPALLPVDNTQPETFTPTPVSGGVTPTQGTQTRTTGITDKMQLPQIPGVNQ